MLGASSSLGLALSTRLNKAGATIYGTTRAPGAAVLEGAPTTKPLSLDLASDQSCESFVKKVADLKFETVILLIGSLYIPWARTPHELGTVKNYFEVFVSRYLWIVDQLITEASSPNFRILNVSSRAAVFGSYDHYYSAAKSSMDLYLLSKCRNSGGSLKVLSAVPGLIEGSGMASHFEPHHVQNHRQRASAPLLTVSSAAVELAALLDLPLKLWDGRTVTIGPVYN